jgi:very-short-patch-repair endonuclease
MSESEAVGVLNDPTHTRISQLEQEILQLRDQNELLTLKFAELETRHCELEKVVSTFLAAKQSSPSSIDTGKAIKTSERSTARKTKKTQTSINLSTDIKHDAEISTTERSNTILTRLNRERHVIQRTQSVRPALHGRRDVSIDQLSTGLQSLSLISFERKPPSKLETATSIILINMDLQYNAEYELMSLPYKRYDFFVAKYNLLIEVDGRQHFMIDPQGDFVTTNEELQKGQDNDILKTQNAITNQFRILRIHYQCFNELNGHKAVKELIMAARKRRTEPLILSNRQQYTWLIDKIQVNKMCIKCLMTKTAKDFPSRSTGWSSRCKDCHCLTKLTPDRRTKVRVRTREN